jgi:ubiquinone/menaquinone biosynthesis C-methylase UbiE
MPTLPLPPAAFAFDAIAQIYDSRFTPWLSVAAQRRAVRASLIGQFPQGSRLLEVGGGTGDDAIWMAGQGRQVMMTDASAAMVQVATGKMAGHPGVSARVAPAEAMEELADDWQAEGGAPFDGAYSVFAPLNCVTDLAPFARGMARLVRPGGALMLVVFGITCPGEVVTEAIRGRPRNMLRRLSRGDVPARLSGRPFTVRYHRKRDFIEALGPWFDYGGRKGIGVFVPPSAAEPWISRFPRALSVMEGLDRLVARPLAPLGDHVLYRFVRRA